MPDSQEPDSTTAKETLIHNERLKLTATFLNGVGIAVIAIGGLTPLFATGGVAAQGPQDVAIRLVGVAASLTTGVSLHVMGRTLLMRLRS